MPCKYWFPTTSTPLKSKTWEFENLSVLCQIKVIDFIIISSNMSLKFGGIHPSDEIFHIPIYLDQFENPKNKFHDYIPRNQESWIVDRIWTNSNVTLLYISHSLFKSSIIHPKFNSLKHSQLLLSLPSLIEQELLPVSFYT